MRVSFVASKRREAPSSYNMYKRESAGLSPWAQRIFTERSIQTNAADREEGGHRRADT